MFLISTTVSFLQALADFMGTSMPEIMWLALFLASSDTTEQNQQLPVMNKKNLSIYVSIYLCRCHY